MSKELQATSGQTLDDIVSRSGRFTRFAVAALGSIPWVGGLFSASAALSAEGAQTKVNKWFERWLQEHQRKADLLQDDLTRVVARIEMLGDAAGERVQEESYLSLVRKGFRVWDRCETDEKREYVLRLLGNAAGTNLTDDDVVRLFLDWIDRYHEAHFGIIRAVYKNRGITRWGIWMRMGRERSVPRENSSDADLFRMLIHDLSTGRVIRQEREVTDSGEFLKKSTRGKSRRPASPVMKSSFDDEDRYELSELGQLFVHYVLHDVVMRIEDSEHDS